MDRETRRPGRQGRPPLPVRMLIKLMQVVLLIAVLSVLVFGVVEAAMSAFHLARGVPVEGRVTDIVQTEVGSSSTSGRNQPSGSPLKFPVISYSWPPEDGSRRWLQSLVPREDLERGDEVTVRVIPGYENLARADRSIFYYLIVAVALGGGWLFTWAMFSRWYSFEVAFGQRPVESLSIFSGLAGKVLIFGVGGPALAILLFHLYFVPWMKFNEYVAFADRPGRLLFLAAERGGPPTDGPLNAYERRLLTIPGLNIGISQDALNRAFSTRDTETLRRYIDAIKDPDIAFSVDSWRGPRGAATSPPDILRLFLESGVELTEEGRLTMLEEVEQRNDAAKLAILAEFGITPQTVNR